MTKCVLRNYCACSIPVCRELDRGAAEDMLKQANVEGGFIIRKKAEDKFVVSVLHQNAYAHHMVSHRNGQWQHKKTAFMEADAVDVARALLHDNHVANPVPLDLSAAADGETEPPPMPALRRDAEA